MDSPVEVAVDHMHCYVVGRRGESWCGQVWAGRPSGLAKTCQDCRDKEQAWRAAANAAK